MSKEFYPSQTFDGRLSAITGCNDLAFVRKADEILNTIAGLHTAAQQPKDLSSPSTIQRACYAFHPVGASKPSFIRS